MDVALLVIGAGTAGSLAARTAVDLGARTAIVEHDGFAGTCLGVGWIPKKVLVSTVELAWRARRAGALGLTGTASLGLDWGAVHRALRRLRVRLGSL